MQEEDKCQQECETIINEVKHLKETIKKQKIQLKSLDKEETGAKKSKNEVSLLYAKIETLNKTLNEEKLKFDSFLAQGRETLKQKDHLIQYLQKQINADSVAPEAPKKIKHHSKDNDTLKCEDCGVNVSNVQSLKIHKNTEHAKQKHDIFICKVCSYKFMN